MGLLSMQHQPQHQQQGHTPSQQQLHSSRPSSVVHQQHQAHGQPPQQPATAYSASGHSLATSYQHGTQTSSNNQDNLPYYSHQSPYSTPGAASGYTSADTSEMMAAAQIPRPHHYPPMSYHTPQSNSPASVPSPSQHDQHRSIYGPPPSQHMPQSMYYQSQPPHYQSMPPQHNASPYGQPQPTQSPYGQHPQHPQSMTSQPNMMMSHPAPQNHMAQHAAQHAQAGMTGSPRPKIEPQVPLQLQKPQGSPMAPQQQHPQNGAPQLHSPGSQGPGGVNNPNAAPGPIPATTPLVVRQDGNGVQWIAFEYSRDRVKMEYTIRCDVESVNTDDLPQEFKQENCVYPRACCAKDQYRGNRLIYETDCNRVGWALAQLNPSLRGKRGLIQRAVDSWRNSNQDPRLRSRRVRRMAKVNGRGKSSTPSQSAAHLPTPTAAPGMPSAPGAMPQNHAQPMGKPGMGHMAQPMHHHAGAHQDANGPGGDEVGEHDYHHQNHQEVQGGNDVRHNQVFTGYGAQGYPASAHGPPMSHMASHATTSSRHEKEEEHAGLFPDMPEAKKRKFILVEDNARGSRLRVRVTLQGVDTNEIPDSFRKSSSVYPGSFFRREMQSPPPSATGTRFFPDDLADDGIQETEGRSAGRGGVKRKAAEMVKASVGDDQDGEVAIERLTKSQRQKEVKLNDLGYRMAWLQSRVFSGRTVFLQRALDCYRNKTRVAIESNMQDVKSVAPHFETRAGKRRWNEFSKRGERRDDE